MKTIIAGGRNYYLTDKEYSKLDDLRDQISQVVSGAATGVDSCGEMWGRKNNIPIKMFQSDWKTHGKQAGYLRNKQMIEYSDACILFNGGVGTQMIFELASKYGLKIYDYRTES